MAKKIQEQKEEERVVSKSRLAAMNLSSFISTSSSTAASPIASKSPVMLITSEKPDSRMSIDPNSFDAASTSQLRLKDAYLGGLMEKQRGNPSLQEEQNSEDSDNPEAEIWYYKGKQVTVNSLPKTVNLVRNLLHTERVFQLTRRVKKDTEATWKHLSPNIVTHIPLCGYRLLHGQGNLWKTTWRSYERLGCEMGYFGNVHECHLSSSGSKSEKTMT